MAVTTVAYCSREDAQRSIDFQDNSISNAQLDRAIQDAARNIEGELHRLFYPIDETRYWDWPNYQRAYPWKLNLDRHDLVVMTALSSGGVAIPLNQVFLRPQNPKPGFPYTWVELDRSTQAAWGGLQVTPQNAIAVTGTWGFGADADAAGTLAANITAGATTITVSDGSQCGPGDILIAGYGRGAVPFPGDTLGHAGLLAPYTGERMLVTDRSWNDSGFAQSSGCSTASAGDNVLTATGGTWSVNEMIQLDTERMLILAVDTTGLKLTVRRAWDATILAAHGGAEVFVSRSLSVLRGQFGTTAASASGGAALFRHRPPSLVRDLAIAEATNRVLQETSGYARTVGSADSLMPATGAGLADLWDEAETAYGRKHRIRAI